MQAPSWCSQRMTATPASLKNCIVLDRVAVRGIRAKGRSARLACSSVPSAVGVAGAAANRKRLTDYPSVGNARIIERVQASPLGEKTLRIATWLMQSKD